MNAKEIHAALIDLQSQCPEGFDLYTPVSCPNEFYGAINAKFKASPDLLLKVMRLAEICQDAGAAEITVRLSPTWSTSSLRSDTDRMEISPPGRSRDLGETDIMIRCYVSDSEEIITSNILRVVDIVQEMQKAHKEGRTAIVMDPYNSEDLDTMLESFESSSEDDADRPKNI